MSTVAPSPPPSPTAAAQAAHDQQLIDLHIARTRRTLKLVDLSTGLLTLVIGLLAFLLVAAVIDHWLIPGGLGVGGRAALLVLLAALVVMYSIRQFGPLLRSINPVYAAHAIERRSPTLKNSLLNLLLFRTHRQPMSAKVYAALEHQAAQRLSGTDVDAVVDRTALLRLGYVLVAVVAMIALYSVLSPKNLVQSAGRVLAPWADIAAPSRVQILDVHPGNESVARGERVPVSAEILGATAEDRVQIHYSAADKTLVDEIVPMTRPDGSARFSAHLPRNGAGGGGVEQDLIYWIEAGDARSKEYKLTVYSKPTIIVQRLRYEPPAYTGESTKEVANTGDIRGLEGTRVTIEALANQPIRDASIDFDADGKLDVPMQVSGDRAVGVITLRLREDRRTPAHPSYSLRFTTASGRTNDNPARYKIDVTADYGPEVRITRPEEPETTARPPDVVPIGVEARDVDFALSNVRLVGRVGQRAIELGDLLSEPFEGRFSGIKPIAPEAFQLKPGDVLEYWAEARDNRVPEPNSASSEHRRLRIVGPNQKGQGQQRERGQGGGGNRGKDGQQGQKDQAQPPGDGEKNGGQQDGQQQNGEGQQGQQQNGQGQQGEGQQGQSQSGEGQQGQSQQGEGQQGQGQQGQGQQGEGQQSENQTGQGQNGQQQSADQSNQNGGQQNGQNQQGGGQGQQDGAQGADQNQGGSPQDQSGQTGQQNQPGQQGEQSRVSPDGDDDGTAFQRISDHMAEQDANGGQGDAESNQSQENNGQQGKQSNSAAEASAKSKQQSSNKSPQSNASQGNASENNGAESAENQNQPGGQQQQNSSDSQSGNRSGQGKQTSAGKREQGEQGADEAESQSPEESANPNADQAGEGESSDNSQGSPEGQQSKQRRDKSGKQDQSKTNPEEGEAGAGGQQQKESDSRGQSSGERSGGGQEGAGQQADAEGKGETGEHQSAEEGAGQSSEQGEGETGSDAGEQSKAEGETGQSSGDQPGKGSESRESANGASGEGQSESDETQASAGSESSADSKAKGAEGAQEGGSEQGSDQDESSAGGESQSSEKKPGEESADASKGAESSDAADQSQSGAGAGPGGNKQSKTTAADGAKANQEATQSPGESSSAASAADGQSQGGGAATRTANSPAGSPPPPVEEAADQANLDFAKQKTDLVLDRLNDQLAKHKVDPELLKSLGWSADDLQRFVDRWRGLKNQAAGEGDAAEEAQRQLDAALRSLGLKAGDPQRVRATARADKLRDLNEGYRARTPAEYADRVRAYVKGAAESDSDR